MSKEEKEELRKNGFHIIQTWQIILVIIAMFISLGVTYGVATTKIDNLEKEDIRIEKRIDGLDSWKKERTDASSFFDKRVYRLEIMTEGIAKKFNVDIPPSVK